MGMRARSPSVIVAFGAILAALMASCGSGGAGDGPQPALYRTEAIGGDGALLEGVLAVEGPCVYIRSDVSGELVLPLFPEATTAWDRDRQLLTFEGEEYAVGDAIAVGGGTRDLSDGFGSYDFATAPDPECRLEDAFSVPRSY